MFGSTSTEPTSAPPRKYDLILEIGEGGMSRVYLAAVRGVGGFKKLVVLKRLLPSLAEDPEFLQMFVEEARLSARLNHSNIVQINDVGFDGTHHYMAMEYLEGQSLETLIRRGQATDDALPLGMHLRIIVETCAGLHYAHELTDLEGNPINLVHRDVSPHNVFVTYSGQVKLLDFGIAKAADSSQQTRTGVLKGKCGYMAPEQFGGKRVDRRADIFAVGVMIWQAITKRRLWKGLSDIEIFQRLAIGDIPSPATVAPNLSPELVAICNRALAVRPEERYATVAELSQDLETYLAKTLPRFQQRDIGKYVAEHFEAERARVKAAIEGQLNRGMSGSADVPVLRRMEVDGRDTTAVMASERAVSVLSTPAQARPSVSPIPWAETGPPMPPPVQKSRASLFAAAGFALLLVVGGILVFRNYRRAQERTEVEPPVAIGTASSASAPQADLTELIVEASPGHATIFVDDVQLSSNPGMGRFVRDRREHRIRAEASGHASATQMVVYEEAQQKVSLRLEPVAPSPAVHARPVAHSRPVAPVPSPPASSPAPSVAPPPATTVTSQKPKKPTLDPVDFH